MARVLGLFGVTGQRYDDLIEFARSASEPNLIAKPGRHKRLLEISEFERSAEQIVHVAPLVIPGPMQTREYAKEVMAGLPAEERDLRGDTKDRAAGHFTATGEQWRSFVDAVKDDRFA